MEASDEANADALAALKSAYEKKVSELNGVISTNTTKISQLETSLSTEIASIKAAYDAKVANIETLIAELQAADTSSMDRIAALETQVAALLATHKHTEVIDQPVAPTCTQTGLTIGKRCSECKEILIAQEIIPALGHTEVIDPAISATCTATGLTEGKHCSVCGETLAAQTVVGTLAHTEVRDVAVEPTCTTDGWLEGSHCSVCNKILATQEAIPALGHTWSVWFNVKEAKCEEVGLAIRYCTVCNYTESNHIVIDHIEVIDEAVAPNCTETGLTEGKHCKLCDKVLVAQETVDALGHSYTSTFTSTNETPSVVVTFTCECGDTYTETVIPTEFTITADNRAMVGFTDEANENLVIPSVFEYNGTLYKVTSIADNAFKGCYRLTSVSVPNSVTNIGDSAFSGCSFLKSITLPFVGASADASEQQALFGYIFGTTKYSNSMPAEQCYRYGELASDCLYITNYIPSSLTSVKINGGNISAGAFEKCESITDITLADSVTGIGQGAFAFCSNITSITLPASVTSIAASAFHYCTSLTSISLGSGVSSIGERVFVGCTKLTSIVIGSGLQYVGDGSFSDCDYAYLNVYYQGTANDWENISINNNGNLIYASRYYYSSTRPIDTFYQYWHYVDGAPTVWHVHTEVIDEAVVPTCTETGLTEGKHCSVCNEVLVAQETINELGHNCSTEWTTDVAPTCATVGSKSHHCSRCGDKADVTEIPATGNHIPSDPKEEILNPACTANGYVWTIVECAVCQQELSKETTVIPPEHYCPVWKVIKEPTCTEPGIESGRCYMCYAEVFREIDKLGHDHSTDWTTDVEPTCTTVGSKSHHCSRCSDKADVTEISALGHSYTSTVTPPTATENGSVTYTCSTCGDIYTEAIVPTNFTIYSYNRTMVGYTSEVGENLVIPSVFEDGGTWYRVTSIGPFAFQYCYNLTSITIPYSVTNIGESAFENCLYLTSVTIPDSMTSIHACAFMNCLNLTTVAIPDSVMAINARMFDGCSSLRSITIGNSVTYVDSSAFYGCSSLKSIVVKDENSAYYSDGNCLIERESGILLAGCKTSIIPEGVTNIGRYAFYTCSGLKSITIPDSVTCIDYGAFKDCSSLTSITISDSVTTIDNLAFYNCSNLTTITFEGTIEQWNAISKGDYLDDGTGTYTIYCTDGEIAKDGTITCYHPNYSSTVTPPTATEDGYTTYTCSNCGDTYTEAIVPTDFTVTSSNRNMAGYKGVANEILVIPAIFNSDGVWYRVTSIDSGAFLGCNKLTSITIPNTVTSIGEAAFSGCGSLESIVLPFVGDSIKAENDITNRYPLGYIFGTNSYDGSVATNQCYYTDRDTIMYKNYYIPASLKSVTITVGNIPMGAFFNCSNLTSITIPDSVTSIGASAFSGCSHLTSITIPNGVTVISSYTFRGCSSLTSIEIPNGVTYIWNAAFCGCSSLENVTIPSSVSNIDELAFSRCNTLTSIRFAGTVKQWEEISKSVNWDDATDYYAVYCTDDILCKTHNIIIDSAFAPTCTETGLTQGQHCSVCNEVLVAQTVVKELGHTEVIDEAVAPTCTETGLTEGKHCSGCNEVFVAQETVDALGHSHTPTVTPPTATKNGYTTYTCSTCGDTYTKAIIPTDFTVDKGNRTMVGYTGQMNEELVIPAVFENNGTWYRVVAIGAEAFSTCEYIVHITLPESVTTIEQWAFYRCYDLVGITMPKSLTYIDIYAFFECVSLRSIVIPDAVTFIGAQAFSGCNALSSVIFENTYGWQLSVETLTMDITDPQVAVKCLTYYHTGSHWNRS